MEEKLRIIMVSQVSIDGKLTIKKGISSKQMLTLLTEDDYKFTHYIRNEVDGIIVGMNTIRTDNPSLTCRYGFEKHPIRVVTSKLMDFSRESLVLIDDNTTIFLTTEQGAKNAKDIIKNPKKTVVSCGEEKIDFLYAINCLENKYNIHSLMLEGGGELNWEFIKNDLVDEILVMQLPIVVGGRDNTTLVDGKGIDKLSEAKKYVYIDTLRIGSTVVHKYMKV